MRTLLLFTVAAAASTSAQASLCCYSGCDMAPTGCNGGGEFCSQSQGNCENCHGKWCPAGPGPTPPPTPPSPPPTPPCINGTTYVDCYGQLKKKGNRILDKNGDSVKLNGMSMFWSNWAGPFWNADVVKYLVKEWKISLLRCPVGVSNDNGPVSGGYLSDPSANKARLVAVVDAAIEAGIYVVIDWHVEGRCDADQSKPFFAEMAQKYGQQPNVMWETCNEPHGWGWNSGLKAYHEAIIPTIRQHSSNLIIAGTNTWSQDVDEASRDPLSDSNVAYTLHFYSSMHKQANRDKASTAMNNGAAIFVTEWGVEQHNEGHAETNTWLGFLKEHYISNANWGIYDKDSEAWAIVHQGKDPHGDWSDNDLTESGKFMRGYLRSVALSPPAASATNFSSQAAAGAKHCSGRGGCDCDCSWASSTNCKNDDGSCCYACCCGSSPPTPPPTPPTPPTPAVEYCPNTSEDFQQEVEGPPGAVTWTSHGWHIQGQRRVSSKASFDLKGGSIEWDMDVSSSHGGVNNNFYVTYPHRPNCGINCYCDSGATGGCAEIDFTENNGGCYQASTWHEDPSGGDKPGHGGSGGLSGGVVHMKATYSEDGNHVDLQIGGNHYSGNGLAGQMSQYGAVIYSSQWVGWVPGNCGGDGNLQASSFTVSDVKITGRVVQGPEPARCSGPSSPSPPGVSVAFIV